MKLRFPKVAVAVAAAAAMTFTSIPTADASTLYRSTWTPKVVLGGAYGSGAISSSNSSEYLGIKCDIQKWAPATWARSAHWYTYKSTFGYKWGYGRVTHKVDFNVTRGSFRTRCISGPQYKVTTYHYSPTLRW